MLKIRFILRLILLSNCLYIETFCAKGNKCFICQKDLLKQGEIFKEDIHVKKLEDLKCCYKQVCEGCYESAKDENGKCRNCGRIFDVEETCPLVQHNAGPRGNMTVSIKNYPIGHCEKKKCIICDCENTILATFNMYEKEYYRGEVAYFPNNKYGLEALAIFKIAFDNNLLFQMGISVTNRTYGIVFNGIHFKTQISGGAIKYVYPDHGYLGRIKMSASNFFIPCVENNDIINNRKIGKCIVQNYLNKTFSTLQVCDKKYNKKGYVNEKEFKQKISETELTEEEKKVDEPFDNSKCPCCTDCCC